MTERELPDFNDPIVQQAARDMVFDALAAADLVAPPERKAYEAHRSEFVDKMDEERGTAAVRYEEFRTAFEAGAGCEELMGLTSGMHPKDPLRDAAIEDLRSVGCYSRKSVRRPPDAQG